MPILEVNNLTKKFGKFTAVDDISFNIEKGEIVGLLGPNGAGKTTTIMMLIDLIEPTSGNIKIFGKDLKTNREEILKKVNFSTSYNSLPGRLSVYENLYVFSLLYSIKNAKEKIISLLKEFDVYELRNKEVIDLSSGQNTRINLCKAFINDPEILFLDEPTASLDPEIAKKTRDFIYKVRRERNMSILYTSHNMEEIARMCDRVIFLDHGKIKACDTPLNLTKAVKDSILTLTFDAPFKQVKDFFVKNKIIFKTTHANTVEIKVEEERIGKILTELAQTGISITDIIIEKPDLGDVFLNIASKKYEFLKN